MSLLSNLGLRELVAQTPAEYVEIAATLAAQKVKLTELRSSLRQRMRNSPLMDASDLARNLEAAYRRMWLEWISGRR